MLQDIGPFDEALDAGTPTQSGGDHEMFLRILISGYHIIYDPAALCWHRHRRTLEETRKTLYGYGVGTYAFWTRSFLERREFGVLSLPWRWFYHTQLPNIIRSLSRRPGSKPLDLLLAELRGCFIGPGAYLNSRKQYKRKQKKAL
jgi:GT2 family glycosyltransferase